ncbi:MAG: U32 family peptidase [Methylococcales bacterium]|jgi:O2-independent ubiquinone biosynthesis protein UbiV|nr:U32 family peptidase [Methylococcales bacterium]MBT7410847.1 U32 family peptidase [Methylococcales bacterium]
MTTAIKISLGPVLYYWEKSMFFDFYQKVKNLPVDVVYLGETVCSKRRALKLEEWLKIAEELTEAGKQVVLSTLTLIEAEAELKTLKRLCQQNNFMVEANDMAAVQLLSNKKPFVAGSAINIYNPKTLSFLMKNGMKRWVFPVELSKQTISECIAGVTDELELEVLGYGRIPLAYSARCFTARAHNVPKDDCQFLCLDDIHGKNLATQEDRSFLTINGIQTQSAQVLNLIDEIPSMIELGVDYFRISPDYKNITSVVDVVHQCIQQSCNQTNEQFDHLKQTAPHGFCNGFWKSQAGLEFYQ